ncbi:hypothetical protein [Motilibacter aurantiacus]|uniref:hypothetical protein n=1 Tax=Motilibacter aurantiacus TaxID=2714955 RepID=UPI00140A4C9F|nr:hypothetical protein [Motilibacter aurantiacus]NHC47240.1 hypothetical protein [Motilibacter aurantiacus]
MPPTRHRSVACPVAAALAVSAAVAGAPLSAPAEAAPEQPRYSLVDLGPLGGTAAFGLGVNNRGVVVGTSRTTTESRPQIAFRATGGTVSSLGTLPGSTFSRAFEVNVRGEAVGEASTASPEVSRAVFWDASGKLTDLGTLGGASAVANDLNDEGTVVGSASTAAGASRAFRTGHRRAMTALPLPFPGLTGASRATAVSDGNHIVGRAPVPGGVSQAILWRAGKEPVVLGALVPGRYSEALDVNKLQTAVGESVVGETATGTPIYHATVWSGGTARDLGTVDGLRNSRAAAVNDAGDVVGHASGFYNFPTIDGTAVLWRGSAGYDLNDLVVGLPTGWVLRTAESVSGKGQIAGYATVNGQTRAFLLTPYKG